MKTIDLDSWESFEKTVSSFLADWKLKKEKSSTYVSTPIFRGHAKASWKLQTTLERFSDRTFNSTDYHRRVQSIRPAVVSLTGENWDVPDALTARQLPPAGYAFMVYLRHHGFPSPLLDWTRSPFVAGYFAFRSREGQKDGRVAIYSYVEYTGNGRSFASTTVHGLGPNLESHRRHDAQHCEYTICWKHVGDTFEYSSHEAAFLDNTSDQGELRKYTLPASERGAVLRKLELMNVTAFSLFGSEESLMETLAYQEIEKGIE